jgi:hypothetical protein
MEEAPSRGLPTNCFVSGKTAVLDPTFSSPKFTFDGQKQNQAIGLKSNGQIVVGGSGLALFDSNGVSAPLILPGIKLAQSSYQL